MITFLCWFVFIALAGLLFGLVVGILIEWRAQVDAQRGPESRVQSPGSTLDVRRWTLDQEEENHERQG